MSTCGRPACERKSKIKNNVHKFVSNPKKINACDFSGLPRSKIGPETGSMFFSIIFAVIMVIGTILLFMPIES